LVAWGALYQNAALGGAPGPRRLVPGPPSIPRRPPGGPPGGAPVRVLLLTAAPFALLPRAGPAARPLRAPPGPRARGSSALGAAPVPGRVVLGAPSIPGWSLVGLAGGASVGVLLLTAALFAVLPRVGLAALPLRARLGQMVSGFSERVELGDYGSIITSDTV